MGAAALPHSDGLGNKGKGMSTREDAWLSAAENDRAESQGEFIISTWGSYHLCHHGPV